MGLVTFGTKEQADRATKRVRAVHRRFSGELPRDVGRFPAGTPWRADAPDQLLWIIATLVDSGRIWGWDDPRMATVRGITRRGMTIPALQEFILKQGPSKNINLMDWTSFWATNKKFIDPVAARYTAVESQNKVSCTVTGAPEAPRTDEKDVHAKNAELGKKKEDENRTEFIYMIAAVVGVMIVISAVMVSPPGEHELQRY